MINDERTDPNGGKDWVGVHHANGDDVPLSLDRYQFKLLPMDSGKPGQLGTKDERFDFVHPRAYASGGVGRGSLKVTQARDVARTQTNRPHWRRGVSFVAKPAGMSSISIGAFKRDGADDSVDRLMKAMKSTIGPVAPLRTLSAYASAS
jgi:hypothetical protein